MVGKPTEQAILIINGLNFTDWETVMVRHAMYEQPAFRFRFTCSEPTPIASNFSKLQIMPGNTCDINLAGQAAFHGFVASRQVFYDKGRHYIEIQGGSPDADLSSTSHVTKTMELKRVTFEQIARSIVEPMGLKLRIVGGQLPPIKFDRVSFSLGVSKADTLDMYARYVGAAITSNPQGDYVIAVGPEQGQQNDVLVEGKNILIGREIIYHQGNEGRVPAASQAPGNDQQHGAQVSHMPFVNQLLSSWGVTLDPKKQFALPSELPTASKTQLQGRTQTEDSWQKIDEITVFCTVYGWLQSSGRLWKHNTQYTVKSPMLVMDGSIPLTAKSVTFTQDSNEGTRTTLELVNDRALAPNVPQSGQAA
jgi:prophage tail gpP-like protein